MDSRKRSLQNDENAPAPKKEWDEASCPICMDHPHNAVLLICTSHNKGCRSYICDTSYRHSNCLDRFKKLKEDKSEEVKNKEIASKNLKCPMCRGNVLGIEVLEDAREYLNLKPRSCSQESCSFSGNYQELRGHARRAHPTARPADIDPGRERAWRRLEDRREYDDVVSAVPGSIVVGDYMIEGGGAQWMSSLVLFQMIGRLDREGRSARNRRRRFLWGENLLGIRDDESEEDEEDEENEEEDDEVDLNVQSDIGPPRRRRRFLRASARSDEEDG